MNCVRDLIGGPLPDSHQTMYDFTCTRPIHLNTINEADMKSWIQLLFPLRQNRVILSNQLNKCLYTCMKVYTPGQP